ncbi:MAG: iron-sulfur cluster assembly protein [Prevotellaceae bacterium]|jgi:FeS assembly SUF system protein|nr:iron-sulfur cluster assembly protein [Prevotellaceae bacterium]
MNLETDIIRALRQVFDPEIPVNIYDLGLIYEIAVDEMQKVTVTMTLTAPNCPLADQLLQDVHDAVRDVPDVADVIINLTFEPPWERSRMSEEAMLELGLL